MGLDQFIYKTPTGNLTQQTDFEIDDDGEEFCYWRKHPNLHGWMKTLYLSKGGKDDYFNHCTVLLTMEDIKQLEQDIKHDRLPTTTGPFFGDNADEEYKAESLKWMKRCMCAIVDECDLYYWAGF